MTSRLIFDAAPSDWKQLEQLICQVFEECNCNVVRNHTVKTVRGSVNVDVFVKDETRRPHQVILCEAKHWKAKVPQAVVHSFRTVVADSGANTGYIVSSVGFQPGAREAAKNSNVKLVTWKAFQEELYDRWFEHMVVKLVRASEQICDLADGGVGDSHQNLVNLALTNGGEPARQQFDNLEKRYAQFSFASGRHGFNPFVTFPLGSNDPSPYPGPVRVIYFKSARMYFDMMFDAAPRAFREYAEFLLKHTDGRCGNQQIFDSAILRRLKKGKTKNEDVRPLLV